MFLNHTTFVLGAGASWHYGFPTGETLVGELIGASNALDYYAQAVCDYGQIRLPKFVVDLGPDNGHAELAKQQWDRARAGISEFKRRVISADPVVIDYFLGHNPQLADIGRLLIAWVIFERAQKSARQNFNANRDRRGYNDNWIRFIVSRLALGCEHSHDLLSNNVHFVTFNYDNSLETGLKTGLNALAMFDKKDIEEFLSEDRIVHVYGSVKDIDSETLNNLDFKGLRRSESLDNATLIQRSVSYNFALDLMWSSSRTLKIIDPINKDENQDAILTARQHVLRAQCLYILGFGFDINNCRRIGLGDLTRNRGQSGRSQIVNFTNYQDSNRISKIAGHILANEYGAFLEQKVIGDPGISSYWEMSKNVYDALSLDFFDFDQSLLPDTTI